MVKHVICLPQDDRFTVQCLVIVPVVLIDDLVIIHTRRAHATPESAVPAAIDVASKVELLSPSVIDGHLIVPQVDALWRKEVIEAVTIGSERVRHP